MKILVINPNSDLKMTAAILEAANNFTKGKLEVICKPTPDSPKFIETYRDVSSAAQGMIQLVEENENKVDGFINACHCDPNLDLLKEISSKPVVGIGEASMKIASMLGDRFSVISSDLHSIPNKEALINKYHLSGYLASVRAPVPGEKFSNDFEKYLKTSQLAIEEDMAEVIVLGCAGMAGLDKELEKKLGVPVLDGVICALIVLTGLIEYQVGISKQRRYNSHY